MTTEVTRHVSDATVLAMSAKDQNELRGLIDRLQGVKNPQPQDVAALRALLVRAPGICRWFAGIAEATADGLIASMTAGSVIAVEALKRERIERMQSMGYDTASGLETVLIETVVLCYMRYTDSERRFTQVMHGGADVTITQADRWDRRLEAEQKRYVRAVLALARVRRLMQPMVAQVNIGGQQVNVSQAAT
jgi:hypothetical protein